MDIFLGCSRNCIYTNIYYIYLYKYILAYFYTYRLQCVSKKSKQVFDNNNKYLELIHFNSFCVLDNYIYFIIMDCGVKLFANNY